MTAFTFNPSRAGAGASDETESTGYSSSSGLMEV